MIATQRSEVERLEEFLRENFRLDQRIEAIKNRKLYSLEIELTRRCNLECIYCYNSSSRNPGIPDFNYDLLKRILREAYDYGIRSITYLGGEPTLHPEICEIIKFTKDIGMEEVVLYTNGTVMHERLLDSINKYVDSVVIHMDTVSRDTFADLHNIERDSSFKYFEAILNNLQWLMLSGYRPERIRHCLTLFRPTYETLEKTLRWAIQDKGMLTSIFIPVVPTGRGKKIAIGKELDSNEIKQSYEIRANIEKRPELLLLGPSEYFKQYQMSTCYISATARVYPYAAIEISYGDLCNEKLTYIIRKYIDELSFRNCKHCENCISTNYCFGTIAAISNSRGNDILCWKYSSEGTELVNENETPPCRI